MRKLLFIPVAAALLLQASCSNDGCLDNQSAIPLAGIYSSTSGDAITLSGVQIMGVGAPDDSLLVASGAIRQVYLPMRSTASVTRWCFHYTQEGLDDESLNDYISFTYTSEPYFASEECGAMYRYHITAVEHTCNLLDSVVVTDSIITNTDIERIRLYFRTSLPDQGDDETTPETDTPDNTPQ